MDKENTYVMLIVYNWFLIVSLTFASGLPAWAKTTDGAPGQPALTATIQGKITDTKGKAIEGATVTTEPPTHSVVSRADGSYVIPAVPAGAYWITAKTPRSKIGVGMTRIHVVTAASDAVPGIHIRVRGGETFQEKWSQSRNAVLTSLALSPIGTLVGLSIAQDSFSSSADEARKEFDDMVLTSPVDFLLKAELWEKSQKLEIRKEWMTVTSLNLLVDSLPFYWYWVKGKRMSDRSLILYYGSQAVIFGTWAAIDWDRSSDAETLADTFAERIQFHEATKQQGKKGRLRERAKWLAVNAALDAAFGYLYWKVIPQSTDRGYVHLQGGPQLSDNRVAISVSWTFR